MIFLESFQMIPEPHTSFLPPPPLGSQTASSQKKNAAQCGVRFLSWPTGERQLDGGSDTLLLLNEASARRGRAGRVCVCAGGVCSGRLESLHSMCVDDKHHPPPPAVTPASALRLSAAEPSHVTQLAASAWQSTGCGCHFALRGAERTSDR